MKRKSFNLRNCSKSVFFILVLLITISAKSQTGFATTGTVTNTNPNAITVHNGVYVGFGRFSNYNLAIGSSAANGFPLAVNGNGTTGARWNTAIGRGVLTVFYNGGSTQIDTYNTGVGSEALNLLTSGTGYNTAVGASSMASLVSGANNTAVGVSSMQGAAGSTANNNCAFGASTLFGISTGSTNCAFGNGSLNKLTAGTSNCAFGDHALQRLIGTSSNNIAIGINALGNSSFDYTGSNNIVIGANAMPNQTTGNNNIAIGQLAQVGNTTASNQLCIQNIIYGVNNSGTYGTISTGSIGIGKSSSFGYTSGASLTLGTPTPPANFTLAVNGWTSSTAFVALSDKRLKKEIKKIEKPLEKISKLGGYTYFWNKDNNSDRKLDGYRQAGFIAQEVLEVLPEAVVKCEDGIYGLNYNAIMPLLTEGIKEQQTQIESQNLEIENLKSQITELQNKFNQLTPGDVKIKLNSLEVVPNPITGISIVSYKFDNANTNSVLVISDLQGKLLKQIPLAKNQQQGQVQVNKKDLPSGMYVFTIVSGNAEVQSKKVLVSE